jgi:hypothetical protein
MELRGRTAPVALAIRDQTIDPKAIYAPTDGYKHCALPHDGVTPSQAWCLAVSVATRFELRRGGVLSNRALCVKRNVGEPKSLPEAGGPPKLRLPTLLRPHDAAARARNLPRATEVIGPRRPLQSNPASYPSRGSRDMLAAIEVDKRPLRVRCPLIASIAAFNFHGRTNAKARVATK